MFMFHVVALHPVYHRLSPTRGRLDDFFIANITTESDGEIIIFLIGQYVVKLWSIAMCVTCGVCRLVFVVVVFTFFFSSTLMELASFTNTAFPHRSSCNITNKPLFDR